MQLAMPLQRLAIVKPAAGASFPQRAAAQIIDTILHTLVIYVAAFSTGTILRILAMLLGQPATHFTTKLSGIEVPAGICALAGYIAYHTACESLHGATLGKLIMKLHVCQDDGSPCKLGPALIRSAAYYIDSLFFGLVAAGSMRSTPLQQRYGDKWAHTVVIERSKLNNIQWPSGWRFLLALLLGIFLDGAMYAAVIWIVALS
jgi:uncharacterized RDD family membrane protein YckC